LAAAHPHFITYEREVAEYLGGQATVANHLLYQVEDPPHSGYVRKRFGRGARGHV
jgi:hypothetical protein